MFKCGFSLSEDEAKHFKACAALDNPNPFSSMKGKFGWIIGDNFDHNTITLTGHDTMHVMGLMVTETPSSAMPNKIKRYTKNDVKQNVLPRIEILDTTLTIFS